LTRPHRLLSAVALVVGLLSVGAIRPAAATVDLPTRLTDQEFWQLSGNLSEPNGVFQSDNLLSNEVVFGRLVPDLVARTKPGGVYLGVGPEQNFTYIAAMKPRMAFITDIRRGNLHLQLMYKALFELSKDRAEFVSRLFTKPRPATLTAVSTVREIMDAYWDIFPADEAAFLANLTAVQGLLTKVHRIPLDQTDLDGIAAVYRAFYWYGPGMTYSARTNLTVTSYSAGPGTYWAMMTQTDQTGQAFSYLASEEKFAVLKDLESRNLIVPVVGNFAGSKALRAVGAYIKDHGATVSAFYLSNVESYLQRDGSWGLFCSNVATFPLDDASVFIRPSSIRLANVAANSQRSPLQFLVFVRQANGTFTTTVQNAAQTGLTFVPDRIAGATSSASLVPPRSSPAPPAAVDDQIRSGGLVPIKAEVSACGGK